MAAWKHHEKEDTPVAARADSGAALDQSAVDAVMKKYDRESNTRVWEGWQKWVVYAVMAAFSLFVIYVTLFASWLDLIRYPSFMGGVLLIGYLTFPAKKGVQRVNHIPWGDWLLMLLGTAAFFYAVVNAKDLTVRLGMSQIRPYEIAIAIVGILATLELCRRSVGIPILCVAGVFLIYALYYYTASKNLGFARAVRNVSISLFYKVQGGGILGTPVQVCAKFIIVFIVFGAFLERTGISQFFIDLANSLVGRFSGGPAKVAVISSALCGMVSGSSVGNTVTTGSVTIPMMKKTGYKPEFAGAVEAAASTGGQIMPPIMGAAAFLMAEMVGVPYSDIVVRAVLPAVLYFLGIFLMVHLRAKRLGLKGIPRKELPKVSKLLPKLYLLIPLVALVVLICSGYTMSRAAIIATLLCIAVSLIDSIIVTAVHKKTGEPLDKSTLLSPGKILNSLETGAKNTLSIAVACGIAGIIAGVVTMTGLGQVFISAIVGVSHGNMMIALFLTMLCCIVLGMGVPTTATYIIMATTCAPILTTGMGLNALCASMFVFYFGIVADITPPVALAAYAGSAIAKSNPMRTAFNATKLAIAAFLIPYIFCLSPGMLLIDTTVGSFILIAITSFIGMFAIAAAIEGYMFGPMNPVFRILIAAGGLALMYPGTLTDVIGCGVVVAIGVIEWLNRKKKTAAA